MPTPIPLTDKMLAYAEVPNFDYNETVDWALDMLLRDYETPSLLILAGLAKPVNQWEARSYLQAAGRELGLSFEDGSAATRRYIRYLVGQVAAGHRKALTELYREYHDTDYESGLADFFLIHWAWEDFDFGETYSCYWSAATPQNIESWMLAVAGRWLEETGD